MDIEKTEEKYFSTRDLTLAAVLVTKFQQITNIDQQIEGDKGPVGYFSFKDTQDLRDLIADYREGNIRVEPKNFTTNVRWIKSEVNNIMKIIR